MENPRSEPPAAHHFRDNVLIRTRILGGSQMMNNARCWAKFLGKGPSENVHSAVKPRFGDVDKKM